MLLLRSDSNSYSLLVGSACLWKQTGTLQHGNNWIWTRVRRIQSSRSTICAISPLWQKFNFQLLRNWPCPDQLTAILKLVLTILVNFLLNLIPSRCEPKKITSLLFPGKFLPFPYNCTFCKAVTQPHPANQLTSTHFSWALSWKMGLAKSKSLMPFFVIKHVTICCHSAATLNQFSQVVNILLNCYFVVLAVFISAKQMAHTSQKSRISISEASRNFSIRTDSAPRVA